MTKEERARMTNEIIEMLKEIEQIRAEKAKAAADRLERERSIHGEDIPND